MGNRRFRFYAFPVAPTQSEPDFTLFRNRPSQPVKIIGFFVLGLLSGCKMFDKVACYEEKVERARSGIIYRKAQASAATAIPGLVAKTYFNPLYQKAFGDSSIVYASKIDDAIFFSPDSSKCVVPVLMQTIAKEDFDEILYIQGTRKETGWTFSTNRMPRIGELHSLIKKKRAAGQWINYSFAYLSQRAQFKALHFGIISLWGRAIDSEFWFKE